jgi:hypothetical protein
LKAGKGKVWTPFLSGNFQAAVINFPRLMPYRFQKPDLFYGITGFIDLQAY